MNDIIDVNWGLFIWYLNSSYIRIAHIRIYRKTDISALQLPDEIFQLCAVLILLVLEISGTISVFLFTRRSVQRKQNLHSSFDLLVTSSQQTIVGLKTLTITWVFILDPAIASKGLLLWRGNITIVGGYYKANVL